MKLSSCKILDQNIQKWAWGEGVVQAVVYDCTAITFSVEYNEGKTR